MNVRIACLGHDILKYYFYYAESLALDCIRYVSHLLHSARFHSKLGIVCPILKKQLNLPWLQKGARLSHKRHEQMNILFDFFVVFHNYPGNPVVPFPSEVYRAYTHPTSYNDILATKHTNMHSLNLL